MAGGMAKGAYEIGALRAIDEMFPHGTIQYVSASSVGVLNSYAFLTNQLDRGAQMWHDIEYNGTHAFIGTILKSAYLQDIIHDLVRPGDRITETFYSTLLNIGKLTIEYKNFAKINPRNYRDYLRASVAMPIYNKAVIINGDKYFDGAMADNIPTHPLMRHNLDYIICLHFDNCTYTFENEYFDNKVVNLTYRSDKRVSDAVTFRHDAIDHLIDEGYVQTRHTLRKIFANGIEDYEAVYREIEKRNGGKRELRVTGDTVTTNINRLAQKLARRKISY